MPCRRLRLGGWNARTFPALSTIVPTSAVPTHRPLCKVGTPSRPAFHRKLECRATSAGQRARGEPRPLCEASQLSTQSDSKEGDASHPMVAVCRACPSHSVGDPLSPKWCPQTATEGTEGWRRVNRGGRGSRGGAREGMGKENVPRRETARGPLGSTNWGARTTDCMILHAASKLVPALSVHDHSRMPSSAFASLKLRKKTSRSGIRQSAIKLGCHPRSLSERTPNWRASVMQADASLRAVMRWTTNAAQND